MRKTTKMVAVLAAMSVMVLGAATMVSAAEKKNGWAKEGSDWYYYVNDKAVANGWALSGDDWYFLDDEGKMAEEAFINADVNEVVESDEVTSADIYEYYYVGKGGAMVTGWAQIKTGGTKGPTGSDDKVWYYFGASGLMYADTWVESGDNWYFVDEDGAMLEYDLVEWDGKEYYLAKDGAMVTGWYKTVDKDGDKAAFGSKDKWIYAKDSGELVESSWQKINNKWYYFGSVSHSATVSGLEKSGNKYVMQEKVFIQLPKVDKPAENDMFYLLSSGAMETGLFKIVDDSKNAAFYLAKGDGRLEVGMKTVSNKYYLFDTANYARIDEDTNSDDLKYVFVPDATKADSSTYVLNVVDSDADAREYVKTSAKGKLYKIGSSSVWEQKN